MTEDIRGFLYALLGSDTWIEAGAIWAGNPEQRKAAHAFLATPESDCLPALKALVAAVFCPNEPNSPTLAEAALMAANVLSALQSDGNAPRVTDEVIWAAHDKIWDTRSAMQFSAAKEAVEAALSALQSDGKGR